MSRVRSNVVCVDEVVSEVFDDDAFVRYESMSSGRMPLGRDNRKYDRKCKRAWSRIKAALGQRRYDTAVKSFRQAEPFVRKGLGKTIAGRFLEAYWKDSTFNRGLANVRAYVDSVALAQRFVAIEPSLEQRVKRGVKTWGTELHYQDQAILDAVGYNNLATFYGEKTSQDSRVSCLREMLVSLDRYMPKETSYRVAYTVEGRRGHRVYTSQTVKEFNLDCELGDTMVVHVENKYGKERGKISVDVVEVNVPEEKYGATPTTKKVQFYQVDVEKLNPEYLRDNPPQKKPKRPNYVKMMNGTADSTAWVPVVSKNNLRRARNDPESGYKLPKAIDIRSGANVSSAPYLLRRY